jgi:hypothetical protein
VINASPRINELVAIIEHGFSVSVPIDHTLVSCPSILLPPYHLLLLLANNHALPLNKAEEFKHTDGA